MRKAEMKVCLAAAVSTGTSTSASKKKSVVLRDKIMTIMKNKRMTDKRETKTNGMKTGRMK